MTQSVLRIGSDIKDHKSISWSRCGKIGYSEGKSGSKSNSQNESKSTSLSFIQCRSWSGSNNLSLSVSFSNDWFCYF